MIELTDYQLRVWIEQWPAVQRAVMKRLESHKHVTFVDIEMLGWLSAMSVQVERVRNVVEDTHER